MILDGNTAERGSMRHIDATQTQLASPIRSLWHGDWNGRTIDGLFRGVASTGGLRVSREPLE
jgi:hypothetical protein